MQKVEVDIMVLIFIFLFGLFCGIWGGFEIKETTFERDLVILGLAEWKADEDGSPRLYYTTIPKARSY